MSESKLGQVKLANVRLSHPKLHEKDYTYNENGRYGASLIIDPNTKQGKLNIAKIEKAVTEVGKDTWGKKVPQFSGHKAVLQDGDSLNNNGEERGEEVQGKMFINAYNRKRIQLFDQDKDPVGSDDDHLLYGGCYVHAIISVYAIKDDNDKSKNGIYASLDLLQHYKDGERFGGSSVSVDDLDDLDFDDEDEAEDVI